MDLQKNYVPFVAHTDAVSRVQPKRPSGRAENSSEAVLIDDRHCKTTLFADSIRVCGSHTYSRNHHESENLGQNDFWFRQVTSSPPNIFSHLQAHWSFDRFGSVTTALRRHGRFHLLPVVPTHSCCTRMSSISKTLFFTVLCFREPTLIHSVVPFAFGFRKGIGFLFKRIHWPRSFFT